MADDYFDISYYQIRDESAVIDLELPQACDFELHLQFVTSTNTPLNLTGYTGVAQIWYQRTETKFADFIVTFNPDRTTGRVVLSLARTFLMTLQTNLRYDFLIRKDDKQKRWIKGKVDITKTFSVFP